MFAWRYLVIIVAFFMILLYLQQRIKLIKASYQLKEMIQQQAELKEEKNILLLESSRLRSPERIERIAIEELGLVRSREPAREIRRPYR